MKNKRGNELRMDMDTMDKYEILKKYFGYDSFREAQEALIDSILDRKSTRLNSSH